MFTTYLESVTEHIHTLYGHNEELFSVKPGGTYAATIATLGRSYGGASNAAAPDS
jgi:hypothetical protein